MSQKKIKQQRKQIYKASEQVIKHFLKQVKDGWGIRERLWLACKIIFKGKLQENKTESKSSSNANNVLECVYYPNPMSFYYSKWLKTDKGYTNIDWASIQIALTNGKEVSIRQADKTEAKHFNKIISKANNFKPKVITREESPGNTEVTDADRYIKQAECLQNRG